MKTFLQYLSEVRTLNEVAITDDTKLFFVGTTTNGYDIEAQKFSKYKELEKITVESAAFGTSTWGYACAYAKQYGTKQAPGVIAAFQLKPGLEFFDLRNPQEYEEIGLPKELAEVFVDCEPYFAINTHIPGEQKAVMPVEFSIAQGLIQIFSGLNTRNVLSLIQNNKYFPTLENLKNDYISAFKIMLLNVFELFMGKKRLDSGLKDQLMNSRFTSINHLMKYCPSSRIYQQKHYEYGKRLQAFAKDYIKTTKSNLKLSQLIADDSFIKAAKEHGFNVKYNKKLQKEIVQRYTANQFDFIPTDGIPNETAKYKYKKRQAISLIPKIDSNDEQMNNLLYNYSLLYANDGYDSKEITDEQLKKVYAYLILFEKCQEYMLKNISEDNQFKNGIKLIQNRLKSKDSESKHVYIDFLQYILFSMLCDEKNEKTKKYVGVTCPEIRGYANVHKFSGKNKNKVIQPYGYEKKINAQTLYFDDMTIIICKPLQSIVQLQDTFGHKIDFIDDESYRKRLNLNNTTGKSIKNEDFIKDLLPKIKACKTVQEYKHVIESM